MRIEPAKDGRNMKDVIDHPSPSKDTSIVENHTDTATDSYDGDSTEQESQYSYDDDDDGRPLPMPPLKYALFTNVSDPFLFGLPDPSSKKSAKIMGNLHTNRPKSPEYHIFRIKITRLFNAHK